MKLLFATLAMLAVGTGSLWAVTPSSPFTECPAVGFDATGCQLLIVVSAVDGTGAAIAFNVYQSTTDTAQIDNCDDTLIGILNSSGAALKTISLTGGSGSGVFEFEADGACSGTYSPQPTTTQCGGSYPGDPGDYGSAGVTFTSYCIFLGSCVGGSNGDSGTLATGGVAGIANGGSTFFTLEGAINAQQIVPVPPTPTPVPNSVYLMLAGLGALATFYFASGKLARAN